ncbi:hypothetical protein AN641_00370 [Candidatus Epulonipiscioides gigas]|nr:hypothetical protein AN641_00370 [Epulopiscium sp. SCG-C07WGA-EpuloA2]
MSLSAVPAAQSDGGALHWDCITEGFSSPPLFYFLGEEGRVCESVCERGVLRGIIESTEGASSLHLMIWR